MAANSLGVQNTQFWSSRLNCKSCFCIPSFPCVIQAGTKPKAWNYSGIMMSQSSRKALVVCQAQSSLITENEPAASTIEAEEEKTSFSGPISQLIPNSNQVESLLTEICETTSIAKFELKLNGFHLHVTRALSQAVEPALLPPSDSVSMSASTTSEVPSLNGPVSLSSLAITKAEPVEIAARTLLERAADEGFVIIQSPRVGIFRRSRTIKGKRAPPACKEKEVVKVGQVICYIEQLGGEIPAESDVSGEVTKILYQDGQPVGYGDAIMVILPSFPGIKKLQMDG